MNVQPIHSVLVVNTAVPAILVSDLTEALLEEAAGDADVPRLALTVPRDLQDPPARLEYQEMMV